MPREASSFSLLFRLLLWGHLVFSDGDVAGVFHKFLAFGREHEIHDLPRVSILWRESMMVGGRPDGDVAGVFDKVLALG